jgi:hypothetical protein
VQTYTSRIELNNQAQKSRCYFGEHSGFDLHNFKGQQQMNDLQIQRYVHSELLILLKAAAMRKPSKFSRFLSALVRAFNTLRKTEVVV